MGRRYFSVFGMVIALAIVLAACGSGDENDAEPTVTRIPNPANAPVLTPAEGGSPVAAEAASPVAVEGTPGVGVSPAAVESPEAGAPEEGALEIASHDIFFEPDTLTIAADTAVTISIPNEGAAPHNFSIDELEISIDQAPGEEQDVEINAPAGEYEFYCNVPGHREAGMTGTLIVE
jgi:nitrite reductase (NO-forming)